jgi:hypothetical protein
MVKEDEYKVTVCRFTRVDCEIIDCRGCDVAEEYLEKHEPFFLEGICTVCGKTVFAHSKSEG